MRRGGRGQEGFSYRRENPGGGLAEAGLRGSAVEALRPAREVEERWALRGGPGVTETPAPRARVRNRPTGQRKAIPCAREGAADETGPRSVTRRGHRRARDLQTWPTCRRHLQELGRAAWSRDGPNSGSLAHPGIVFFFLFIFFFFFFLHYFTNSNLNTNLNSNL